MQKTKENRQKRNFKVNKKDGGITLVALVVTIIILLILAGISIGMLTGDNTIIAQARDCERTGRGRQ